MRRVSQCQRKRVKKPLNFAYALRSFLGHLEGTEKSLHTVRNYKSDLMSFQNFLEKGLGSRVVALSHVSRDDLELYIDFLKAQGFKTNTRRRKLLTVRRLLRYLTQRNKIKIDVGRKLPAPEKIERIPMTVPRGALLTAIRALPEVTELDARNRVLLWSLAETACQVSEVRQIRYEDWKRQGTRAWVAIGMKQPRLLEVSDELEAAIQALKLKARGAGEWLFLAHNKFGPLGGAISARGIELLVRAYSDRLGFPELTPRTFRHSAVLEWFRNGISRDEIQKRLGLRTAYAFRVFEPLFKQVPQGSILTQ